MPNNGITRQPDLFLPVSFERQRMERVTRSMVIIGRLREGVSVAQAHAEIAAITAQVVRETLSWSEATTESHCSPLNTATEASRGSEHSLARGDIVSIYLTGLGPTAQTFPDGGPGQLDVIFAFQLGHVPDRTVRIAGERFGELLHTGA